MLARLGVLRASRRLRPARRHCTRWGGGVRASALGGAPEPKLARRRGELGCGVAGVLSLPGVLGSWGPGPCARRVLASGCRASSPGPCARRVLASGCRASSPGPCARRVLASGCRASSPGPCARRVLASGCRAWRTRVRRALPPARRTRSERGRAPRCSIRSGWLSRPLLTAVACGPRRRAPAAGATGAPRHSAAPEQRPDAGDEAAAAERRAAPRTPDDPDAARETAGPQPRRTRGPGPRPPRQQPQQPDEAGRENGG